MARVIVSIEQGSKCRIITIDGVYEPVTPMVKAINGIHSFHLDFEIPDTSKITAVERNAS